MNIGATTFAQPPERRRCGRSPRADRDPGRTRPAPDRPPNRISGNPGGRSRFRIEFAPAPPFAAGPRRDPGRSQEGDTA
jgi:hypothetical protein